MTRYQYQVDRGGGYEEAFPGIDGGEPDEAENPEAWLSRIEAEGAAERARVLLNNEVVMERDFRCAVVESRLQSDASMQFRVQCSGGQVIVNREPNGELTGEVQPGYMGNADLLLERALRAVGHLDETE
jgi:hypothetical protein